MRSNRLIRLAAPAAVRGGKNSREKNLSPLEIRDCGKEEGGERERGEGGREGGREGDGEERWRETCFSGKKNSSRAKKS